jgi:hypothetical protein
MAKGDHSTSADRGLIRSLIQANAGESKGKETGKLRNAVCTSHESKCIQGIHEGLRTATGFVACLVNRQALTVNHAAQRPPAAAVSPKRRGGLIARASSCNAR